MYETITLKSQIDKSINLISEQDAGGYFESRFVQRTDDTFIIYLSSLSGCDKACRFCHLTQTGQTYMQEETFNGFMNQARSILNIAKVQCDSSKLDNIHFNFMARGDILNNTNFLSNPRRLIGSLEKLAKNYFPDTVVRFKLSTIFPNDINKGTKLTAFGATRKIVDDLLTMRDYDGIDIEFYYSLYSLDPDFRRKWIPKALDPEVIGDIFAGRKDGLRLHYALIADGNDSSENINSIHNWLERFDLTTMVNIVRYNPFNERSGYESDDATRQHYTEELLTSERVQLINEIPFRGKDVYASCGMFFSG